MTRQSLQTFKPWERNVPFSVGVVAEGRFLYSAGITARAADGSVVGPDDMRVQVARCYDNLGDVLRAAGAYWADVVKYTIYTTDIRRFDEETRDIRRPYYVGRPAATLVEVRRLLHPDMLVEIEAVVLVRPAGTPRSTGDTQ